MSIERLNLFESKKEFFLFLLALLLLFCINTSLEYKHYQELKSSKYFTTTATVLNQYPKISKNKKRYYVLRLKAGNFSFITTSYEDIKDLRRRDIRVGIITNKIQFLDYLRGFYAPSYDIELLEYKRSLKDRIIDFVKNQHSDSKLKELFSALFVAEPISKDLRSDITNLGVNHLVAISGYHLGFLYALLFAIFAIIYRFFQDRYFPYRNRRLDLGVIILILLFLYSYLLDFTPSIIRSFAMMIFGFFLYIRHIKIFSFEVLFVSVAFLIALKPQLLFSVGFWFSVSGIFYIYLFLHYYKSLKAYQVALLLNFWVFLVMIPITHFIFYNFSYYQLLSPFLSLLFTLFYPVELLLHFLGIGGVMDTMLEKLLRVDQNFIELKSGLWFLILYITLSLLAIYKRWAFWTLPILSAVFVLFSIKTSI
jgi:competence protein ComEC